jgi:hypothetical protein
MAATEIVSIGDTIIIVGVMVLLVAIIFFIMQIAGKTTYYQGSPRGKPSPL